MTFLKKIWLVDQEEPQRWSTWHQTLCTRNGGRCPFLHRFSLETFVDTFNGHGCKDCFTVTLITTPTLISSSAILVMLHVLTRTLHLLLVTDFANKHVKCFTNESSFDITVWTCRIIDPLMLKNITVDFVTCFSIPTETHKPWRSSIYWLRFNECQ